jgi:hypothetical protein
MKKKLIAKNKSSQSLYRIHSYEDAKKHFPSAKFTSTKRAWRLFLDIEALSEALLEDFTKHLLLFENDDGRNYYIVVNISDQVDETNISDKNMMKAATLLMKNYSVSKTFIEFIKNNTKINETTRIEHIKKFVPEVYLDYVIENDVELNLWDWLPRNLIKKQLLSDPKYLSYLIKKDSAKDIYEDDESYSTNSNTNESSLFIINYILSGTLTKKTLTFLKELFKDESVLRMFQKTIDAITYKKRHVSGCSLTKSILKNIFILEEESIIKINAFNHDFIGALEQYFKDEYLDYLDILINKKIKYIINLDSDAHDMHTKKLFFDKSRFEYLISHAENLNVLISNWRSSLTGSLFKYCFKHPDRNQYWSMFPYQEFHIENLALLLKDPLRSKFIFFQDFLDEIEKLKHDQSNGRSFATVIAQTDLDLIRSKCPDEEFFKTKMIKYYTSILSVWDGKESHNTDYLERLQAVYDIDRDNLQYIHMNYLFDDRYSHLDKVFDFDYNSLGVQNLFEKSYAVYANTTTKNYEKEQALNFIKRKSESKLFLQKYDASKWNNKDLVELLDPLVNFNTDFDLSGLKNILLTGNIDDIMDYCQENKQDMQNVFKHNPDDDFVKCVIKIAATFMSR